MNKYRLWQLIFFLIISFAYTSNEMIFAQTAFTSPAVTSQTGASNSYSSAVVAPETVQPSNGCGETGASWTHNFNGTANKRLTSFKITGTNYYVNNFGSLNTIMRRNNASGLVNPASCSSPPPAIPWHDRQIVFYEGTEDTVANIAQIVNSFPSTTLPGTAGYSSITDMNLVFSKGFINSGADNVFNNCSGTGTGYNSNANNIERMDLFVSGGVAVTAANMNKTGIVIVCRGPSDDPFVLSAIKGLTGGTNIGGGTNYVYDDIIKVNASWTQKAINGGSFVLIPAGSVVPLITGLNSVVLRRLDPDGALNDQLPAAQYPVASSFVLSQNIVAMFFTFANLGLTAGETFYGYSLGALDVTAINSDQYNSYLNGTYFPLTTNPTNGGVDLTGFPGLFSPVDIDDDDDGLPDYLEANLPLAFGDANSDGILNYCDATYPGFVDNNTDGINDNFDPSADSDNDGIPNYRDNSFVTWGWADTNSDGVNDIFDWDMDGVPNFLDRDSDNDGIPDVVESFGVDANGDGVIDNYTDTDVDGFSQNVDANGTGATSSGKGLDAIDTDGDGIPNYFDRDSDNDGIPDVIEAYGTDANNDGKLDSYSDADADGYSDNVDGDVGNDNFSENSSNSLLKTSSDVNSDGKTDSWPNKNIDGDSKPNPYDLDSDGDGITDVREAQFTDADNNGQVDGAINSYGWNTTIAAAGSLSLPNRDGTGRVNVYDIDSDDDGIPDNVEGLSTPGYLLPLGTDTDGDGIDDRYDNFSGFGGNGINPFNLDGDAYPDYLDNDTDGDGAIDRIEGNDLNLNGLADDNVTLTGVDTDGDGLDDRFDNNNSSAEATSAYMGNGGSLSGDPTPGSITTVQHTAVSYGCATERDWRCVPFVLYTNLLSFKAVLQNRIANLEWNIYSDKELAYFDVQRSSDRVNFDKVNTVPARSGISQQMTYTDADNLGSINDKVVYYRLKIVDANYKTSLSNIITLKLNQSSISGLEILPNPVRSDLQVLITTPKSVRADIYLYNANGRLVDKHKENLQGGTTTLTYNTTSKLPDGVYYLQVIMDGEVLKTKLTVLK